MRPGATRPAVDGAAVQVGRRGDRGQRDLRRAVDVVEDRARSGGARPSPAVPRAPSRWMRCSAATTCRSGRSPRRRGRGSAAASPARRRARRPGARRSRRASPRGRTAVCTTAVDDIASPTPRCASPQAWNSGAAITTVSRARIGTTSSSGVSESTPLALPRVAPFGRPVVPDVRITWRPTWRVGGSGTSEGSPPERRAARRRRSPRSRPTWPRCRRTRRRAGSCRCPRGRRRRRAGGRRSPC